MKKIVLFVFILELVLSFANAKGVFVGTEAGYQKILGNHEGFNTKINLILKTADYKFNTSTPIFGIKGGYDFDKFRAYAKFSYSLVKDIKLPFVDENGGNLEAGYKFKTMEFVLGADWTPNIKMGENNFKAAVGGFAGFSRQQSTLKDKIVDKIKNEILSLAKVDIGPKTSFKKAGNKTETSFLLGAKIGGIYTINKDSEVELSLTYGKNFAKTLKTSKIGAFVGYNYKF